MKINTTLTALANVYALVNAANALTLDVTKATIGVPVGREPDADPRNTSVALTAVDGGGYEAGSTVNVNYTRLGMGSGVVSPEFGFFTDGTTTLASFKTAAAVSLGLIESELDFTGDIPTAEGQTTTIAVSAKAGSLLYVGTQDLTVEWPQGEPTMAESVTVTQLDGFDPAD